MVIIKAMPLREEFKLMRESFIQQRKQLVLLSLATITVSILSNFYIDQNLTEYFRQDGLYQLHWWARKLTDLGEGGLWFFIAILAYAAGRWLNLKTRNFGKDLFFSILVSGIGVQFLKFCFGRLRPHMTEDSNPNTFVPFNFDWHYHSLPSGHTQVLFAVATVFSFYFPRYKWAFLVIFSALSFTRVITHQHFLSDVFMGALTGYAISIVFLKRRRVSF